MDLSTWNPPPAPPDDLDFDGRHVRLERFKANRHGAPIHARAKDCPDMWAYLPYGPFRDAIAYGAAIEEFDGAEDQLFFALFDKDLGDFAGHASYLRINPSHGTIELGHIALTPSMQRSRAATEAWALMMGWAFDAGYRRFEWKCNAANAASRRAAERLGFTFEGVHRQAMIVKGMNRDTAWYSVLDSEWPSVRGGLSAWLDPENFTAEGRQKKRLSALR
ncbi:MAG: GNAT family protein [Pseudomonadota bacterium]